MTEPRYTNDDVYRPEPARPIAPAVELDVPALQAEIASRPPVVPNDAWRPEPLPPRWCGRLGRVIRRRHDWRPEPGMPSSVSRCWRCRRLFYAVGTQGTSGKRFWPARP